MKRFFLTLFLILTCLVCSAQIPSVALRDINGNSIRTDELENGGKPFAVMFFATWCKPCNRELDNVAELYDEWREKTGLKIYAISIDEGQNAQKVKPMVDNHEWEYEVLLDSNSDFRRAMGIHMIPHTLIFDGNQKLVFSRSGYQEGNEYHIIEEVEKCLDK